jgi:hypothetical protein
MSFRSGWLCGSKGEGIFTIWYKSYELREKASKSERARDSPPPSFVLCRPMRDIQTR